jgi:alkanesulfonate monooxygenase SsuD/methylene tetrahydromethanopterin reductase-like flavin-dependent oxidoreductase (luciferase family)
MKKIGFLSFGHWTPSPQSQTRSAADTLLQSIELAVAAEELGADGAYFRVHHFARQLASPFPLLAAAGAKTSRIGLCSTLCTWKKSLRETQRHKWRSARS